MIAPDVGRDSAPALRKEFELAHGHGPVARAELLATALGICEVTINGRPVSADVLTPGWTSYEWRLRLARWDVTGLLQRRSVIAIVLGNGWHCGRLGFNRGRALYGPEPAALAELRISYSDGFTQTVVTDESWQSGPSAVTADDLYDGQTIDARRDDPSWQAPGPAPAGWSGVRTLDFDTGRLAPYLAPPVRRTGTRRAQRIWTSPSGRTLVDFGQNLVGWIRMRVTGGTGQEITVRHAEVLENDELGTRPLRSARATDRFILSGGHDQFEPTLTLHGFRYAQIEGWKGSHDELAQAVEAVVVGSDLKRIGQFECSDPLLNQLHANIVWSMRGNFVDVPTDCPQRDERLGWTGDLAAFAPTAAFLYDANAFLQDWLLDLEAEQVHANGQIPVVVPDCMKYEKMDDLAAALKGIPVPVIALWNDAACWVPWAAWMAYGDLAALTRQYPSMAMYARRIGQSLNADGVMDGIQLGDWLDPTAPPDEPMKAKADPHVVATACVYSSVRIAQQAAQELGYTQDGEEFRRLADRIRTAFNAHYVVHGRIASDAAAVYSLAIAFGLLDEEGRAKAGNRLAQLVQEADYRIITGFAGTPFIATALAETGHLETAYRLLLQRGCPSWLYPVTMGATTVWERSDSMLPDRSINPGEMTSFNHYAFGCIGDWMHRVIGGIAPLEPGYRRILIAPRPGGDLAWARASLETPHGRLAVSWELDGEELALQATVPAGTTAVIRLPGRAEKQVGEGTHRFLGRPAEPATAS